MNNVNAMLEVMLEGVQLKRWNGIYKAEDFVETSKQGLNAAIAFILAKMYEETGNKVNYVALIELSICRMVYKTIFTDINPGISYLLLSGLKSEADEFAMKQVKKLGFDEDFCEMFKKYLELKDKNDCIELEIFHAASKLATYWEFNQIKSGAGQNYLIFKKEKDIKMRLEHIKSLEVVKVFMLDENLNRFVDLYANTAFLIRWAKREMSPKISDLSHMYMTAVTTYLFMSKAQFCDNRCIEGFYAGLFHDTIEIMTGDLPHPLKKNIPGLKPRLTEIEAEEYKKNIKPLLPQYLDKSIEKYILMIISKKNEIVVKAADNISAYVEAVNAYLTGSTQEYFVNIIEEAYKKNMNYVVENIEVNLVYKNFYKKYNRKSTFPK